MRGLITVANFRLKKIVDTKYKAWKDSPNARSTRMSNVVKFN